MSKQLLENLNGNKETGLKKFIESLNSAPRIAWYPSAGEDFSPLLFIQPEYFKYNLASEPEPALPDIFIFSDYFPWTSQNFLKNEILYKDEQSIITIVEKEELPKLNLPLHREIVDFPNGGDTINQIFYFKIKVINQNLGTYYFPLIYVFAENESFFCEKLIPNNAKISHIIFKRYGGCSMGGGGKATGIWLFKALKILQTELIITEYTYSTLNTCEGDLFFEKYCPSVPSSIEVKLKIIKENYVIGTFGSQTLYWNLILN